MPAVGFSTFLPKRPDTKFIIRNMTSGTPQEKTLSVFTYPIPPGHDRDLMEISFVSEADIRHSLLKGELRSKAEFGEIRIVESNIDLLQFDSVQLDFLNSITVDGQTLGGTAVSGTDGYGGVIPVIFKQNIKMVGDYNSVNRIFTVPGSDKFINGEFLVHDFRILLRHNGRILVEGVDYSVSESGGTGTGYDTVILMFSPKARSQLFANYVVEA